MSVSLQRAEEYRRTAERLRILAETAALPEVKGELLWLAQSYERLAADPTIHRIIEGYRSLEMGVPEDLTQQQSEGAN